MRSPFVSRHRLVMPHAFKFAVLLSTLVLWSAGASQAAAATWVQQALPVTPKYMNGISCLPAAATYDCWAVGQDGSGSAGIVFATSNGGTTWTAETAGNGDVPSGVWTLYKISCPTINWCWAAGDDSSGNGKIIKTVDGVHWTEETLPAGAQYVSDISCLHTTVAPNYRCLAIAPASATSQVLAMGTDGTSNWHYGGSLPTPTSGFVGSANGIAFVDATHAWVAAGNGCGGGPGGPNSCPGYILASSNAGSSWTYQYQGNPGPYMDDISCYRVVTTTTVTRTCWAAGSTHTQGQVLANNGGATWSLQSTPAPGSQAQYYYFNAIACVSGGHCWTVGRRVTSSTGVIFGNNGTSTFTAEAPPPGTGELVDISCVHTSAANRCWAVGQSTATTSTGIVITN